MRCSGGNHGLQAGTQQRAAAGVRAAKSSEFGEEKL